MGLSPSTSGKLSVYGSYLIPAWPTRGCQAFSPEKPHLPLEALRALTTQASIRISRGLFTFLRDHRESAVRSCDPSLYVATACATPWRARKGLEVCQRTAHRKSCDAPALFS